MPGFKGLKVTQDVVACQKFPDLRKVELDPEVHRMRAEPGFIGSGKNGGFQAWNLAVQFGARRIVLVGFDVRLDTGVHWHGLHQGKLRNPAQSVVSKWREYLDGAADDLRGIGVDVVNASADSLLTAYRKMPLNEALDQWERLYEGNESVAS